MGLIQINQIIKENFPTLETHFNNDFLTVQTNLPNHIWDDMIFDISYDKEQLIFDDDGNQLSEFMMSGFEHTVDGNKCEYNKEDLDLVSDYLKQFSGALAEVKLTEKDMITIIPNMDKLNYSLVVECVREMLQILVGTDVILQMKERQRYNKLNKK